MHNAGNKNFLVGPSSGEFRNYFVFDLTSQTDRVGSAQVIANTSCGSGTGGTLRLFDVTTEVEVVMASHSDGSQQPIWTDLGSGTEYATLVIADAKLSPIAVPLNSAGIAAVNAARGGMIVFGGAYETANGGFVMGCTNSPNQAVLELTTGGDLEPPTISVPSAISVDATGASGATVDYVVTATDAVDGDVAVQCAPASGSVFPLGTTTVTCSAADAAGNAATASFEVTVGDATAPTLSLPASIAGAANPAGTVIEFDATATDAIDGAVPVFCTPPSGSVFDPGVTTVTCTATDAAGNTATGTFDVTLTYELAGFDPPVNYDGTSVFHRGRTVPVKFRLGGASAGITNLEARLYLAKVTSSGVEDPIEATSSCGSPGNVFEYEACDDLYIFHLDTGAMSAGVWQLIVDTGDGVSHSVQITVL